MSRLTLAVPPGACDCHIHAYDAAYPLAPTATFKPPHAPWSDYLPVLQALGLSRGVVVQPTGYGFDNRCTQAAVAALAGRARGVAAFNAAIQIVGSHENLVQACRGCGDGLPARGDGDGG